MASENKSPSYLAERDRVRRWLQTDKNGQYAIDTFKQQDSLSTISRVLDDDHWTNFQDVYEEHKDDLLIAASCQQARDNFELWRHAKGAWSPDSSRLLRIFSPPVWYVLRRQIEVGDPEYWQHPQAILWEALHNPQWATVPAWYLRGIYEDMMPKGAKVEIP